MTENTHKVEKRDEELKAERKAERMDKMWTQIYYQWDDNNPNYKDYYQTKYASGRVVTKDLYKTGRPTTTWERVRERLFAFWDKPKKKEDNNG